MSRREREYCDLDRPRERDSRERDSKRARRESSSHSSRKEDCHVDGRRDSLDRKDDRKDARRHRSPDRDRDRDHDRDRDDRRKRSRHEGRRHGKSSRSEDEEGEVKDADDDEQQYIALVQAQLEQAEEARRLEQAAEERRRRLEAIKAKYNNSNNNNGTTHNTHDGHAVDSAPNGTNGVHNGDTRDLTASTTQVVAMDAHTQEVKRTVSVPRSESSPSPSQADAEEREREALSPSCFDRAQRAADEQQPACEEPLMEQSRQIHLNNQKAAAASNDSTIDIFSTTVVSAVVHPTMLGGTRNGNAVDGWDDTDGYYIFRVGELIDDRYFVVCESGRGVFSTVLRARDTRKNNEEVAIKVLRNHETMHRSGLRELQILQKLTEMDPDNRRHCCRLLGNFEYRNHLCLVMEPFASDLRQLLKRFGREVGISIRAVRVYARQLLIALKHLKHSNILHADIKPDNILVSENKKTLKVADFGSACSSSENEITSYLVSRFYRAPEIALGLRYDYGIDLWSLGCTLYELYTGKILFNGSCNNEMLKLWMELRGSIPKKILKKAAYTAKHFDDEGALCFREPDPMARDRVLIRKIKIVRPTRDLGTMLIPPGSHLPVSDQKLVLQLKDLLEKVFVFDPEKRITVEQALKHPFIDTTLVP